MGTPDPKPDAGPPIDELISLILGGRVDLYEEVIRRYQRDVLNVVGSLLFDRGPVEELVQQVFVNAYFALPQFRRGSDFGRWIRTIARNAAREELRRQSRYDRRLRRYGQMLEARLAENETAAAHEQALIEALQRCVGRLPEREAAAIRLRYSEGKTFEEIAAVLGGTGASIRNLLCRVRAGLRQSVTREMDEP